MTVLDYVKQLASDAVLSETEKVSINTSIDAINTRLNLFFGEELSRQLRFGSSLRGTILPRAMDERSDIDYMVVFKDATYQPQTYLDKLKRFANFHYGSSQIYQSHPTLVLELNHIKFDLVPAVESWTNNLYIPGNSGWMETNPIAFNNSLDSKNKNHSYLIKPAIRLMKYWNAKADFPFASYELEKWMVNLGFYGCNNLRDYLFYAIDVLNTDTSIAWVQNEVARAKRIVNSTRESEKNGYPVMAIVEIKKLFRE
jgi:hypothetical protein